MWSVFQDFVRETDFDEYIVPHVKKVVKRQQKCIYLQYDILKEQRSGADIFLAAFSACENWCFRICCQYDRGADFINKLVIAWEFWKPVPIDFYLLLR